MRRVLQRHDKTATGTKPRRRWDRWASARRAVAKPLSRQRDLPGQLLFDFMQEERRAATK